MDVIDFFKRQFEYWNEIEKCGFCWEFDAPLEEWALNRSQKKTDECCVAVKITDLSERKTRQYNPTTGLQTTYYTDYTFNIHLLKYDNVGTNVYSEIIGHPISESKWETILRPLQECFCEDAIFDFCDLICKQIQIVTWNATTRINWLDNNYTGWSINITLRDYDCNDSNCGS